MQILIIEDDKRISDFILKGLEESNYQATLATTAEDALNLYLKEAWDLIIVDIMLPGMDGIQFIQTLRYKKNNTPVLVLSALNAVDDKVKALDYGADDYMIKPFHFDELLSRVRALTRRSRDIRPDKNSVAFLDLLIDLDQYKVYKGNEEIELSPKEFRLLQYLLANRNKALSRIQILNAVWGINFDSQTNIVDVYISYLRTKLETDRKYIYTVKGIGYMIKE